MTATPASVIDAVVRSVCGRGFERILPLTGGGMNETYRAELSQGVAVVVRIAHQSTPWFGDEARIMAQARAAGVPTPEVFGLEHLEYDGDLLSFSVQEFLPGRSFEKTLGELSADEVERLLADAGEQLARVHSVVPDVGCGIHHELRWPGEGAVASIARNVGEKLGPAAAANVKRGADFLRRAITSGTPASSSLAHGDFLPKNLLMDAQTISGVLDWEFAGPASPAFDLARWTVSAGDPWHDRSGPVCRGYARIADPETAAAGWTAAFAIDWCLELLGWMNPAPPAQVRRCIEVIDRCTASLISDV